jgi:hypothetical protein
MTPQAQLKAVDALMNSKGWNVVLEIMHEEILASAMAIAETPNMELEEINFRRGSIWAAKRMLELPVRLRQKLEAEVALLHVDDSKRRNDA